MPESATDKCKDPARHLQHICQLREQGQQEKVVALMADPGHRCLECNAVAKESQDLCNPSPFIKV